MCGVVGMWPVIPSSFDGWMELEGAGERRRELFGRLMEQSKIRGVHSFGICQDGELTRAHALPPIINQIDPTRPLVAHCRYSTSGDWQDLHNCQPLRIAHIALAFNGVIDMGAKAEMEERWGMQLKSDNDGEIFLRRLLSGQEPSEFLGEIKGSFAGVWLDFNRKELYAARNERRPLWSAQEHSAIWYFSTKDIGLRAGISAEKIREVGTFGIECCTSAKIYGIKELRG